MLVQWFRKIQLFLIMYILCKGEIRIQTCLFSLYLLYFLLFKILMNQVGVTGRTDLGPEYVENIFSGSLKKTSHLRNWYNKAWAILHNFNCEMLKLTKTPILPKCQVPNGLFVNLIIQELKFCKLAQLFIVSVSLVRVFFWGNERKYFPHNLGLIGHSLFSSVVVVRRYVC